MKDDPKFPKDAWIRNALFHKYLMVNPDGSIWRAVKADGAKIDKSKGYQVVTVQTHKKSGRVYFNMVWNGHKKSVLVNRVVAWAYYKNPDNLPQVNHKDGDKANNAVSNLEWASGSDNEKHAHRTGLKSGRGSQNSNVKLTATEVVEIRDLAKSMSPFDLAVRFNISRSTIANVINRKSWQHV